MMMSMLAGFGKLEIEALPGKDQILVPWCLVATLTGERPWCGWVATQGAPKTQHPVPFHSGYYHHHHHPHHHHHHHHHPHHHHHHHHHPHNHHHHHHHPLWVLQSITSHHHHQLQEQNQLHLHLKPTFFSPRSAPPHLLSSAAKT